MVMNPYQVLGIAPTASVEEAKQAYRRLARKYHPDVSTEPNAEERFKEVQAAWEAIKNPRPSSNQAHQSWGGFGGHPFEEVFRNFGFGFGGGPDGAQVRTVRTLQLNITLEEAYRGTTRDVNGARINLPPGVRSNSRFSLNNDELRLLVVVNNHPRFQRTNDDLMLRAHITMTQAILGCELRVRHLDSRVLQARVPAGIQNGQTIRLSGQGMPNPQWAERRGDLFVQVFVDTPTSDNLTEEQKTILRETFNHQETADA